MIYTKEQLLSILEKELNTDNNYKLWTKVYPGQPIIIEQIDKKDTKEIEKVYRSSTANFSNKVYGLQKLMDVLTAFRTK